MATLKKTVIALRSLAFSLAVITSTGALAAPNGAGGLSDCLNDAQVQLILEQGRCYALPGEALSQCISMAYYHYSQAIQACATGSKSSGILTETTPTLKQNLDKGFTRRLR